MDVEKGVPVTNQRCGTRNCFSRAERTVATISDELPRVYAPRAGMLAADARDHAVEEAFACLINVEVSG